MLVREGLWARICDVVVVEERLGACTWRDLGFLLVPVDDYYCQCSIEECECLGYERACLRIVLLIHLQIDFVR
jgi:hypothetical protein